MELRQLRREENSHSNTLTNIAFVVHSASKRTIHVEFLLDKSILVDAEVVEVEEEKPIGINKILDYIIDGSCPPNKSEA